MKKIVVLGATGNIGAYVSLYLKEKGYDVIACGKRSSDNGFFASHGISYLSLDICDKKSFGVLPKDNVFAVVHLAGELPSRYAFNSDKLIESITLGTLNVLDYIKENRINKIIFPQTPFDIWYKHNTNDLIKADDRRSFPPCNSFCVHDSEKCGSRFDRALSYAVWRFKVYIAVLYDL